MTPEHNALAAAATSASARTYAGSFPPNSKLTRVACGAAARRMATPVATLPVKKMPPSPGNAASAAPASLSAPTFTNTSSGTPASCSSSVMAAPVSGTSSEGL